MRAACIRARELGFDGVDINMGCPDKSIEKQGAGACMMKNPDAARAVIRAAKESGLPVSVKTRIGYNKNQIDTWIPEILAERPAVLTIHARTRKEMSLVPARFEHVAEVVQLRDRMNVEAVTRGEEPIETLIFGNGDVTDLVCARARVVETGCDGIMLGRAIFGNPWLFSKQNREAVASGDLFVPTIKERLNVMLEHTKLFVELLGDVKNFAIMKKHYKAYVNGFDGAKELRVKLMEANDFNEIEKIVKDFLAEFR
jgi:tRNA-dihydrouridine synthase